MTASGHNYPAPATARVTGLLRALASYECAVVGVFAITALSVVGAGHLLVTMPNRSVWAHPMADEPAHRVGVSPQIEVASATELSALRTTTGTVLTGLIRPVPLGEIPPQPPVVPMPALKPVPPPKVASPPQAERPLSPPPPEAPPTLAPPPPEAPPAPAPAPAEAPPVPAPAPAEAPPTPAPAPAEAPRAERPAGPPQDQQAPPPEEPPPPPRRGYVKLAP